MRLDFEPSVATIPLVENEVFDDVRVSEDLESLLKNGIDAAQRGEREKARDYLMQAAAAGPATEDAWMWLASISEYPEELIAFLNNVLAINPDNQKAREWQAATRSLLAKTFVQRAVAAYDEGSVATAEQFVDDALTQDPGCVSAWTLRMSMAATDESREAAARRLSEIDPENEDALGVLESLHEARVRQTIDAAKTAAAGGLQQDAIRLLDEAIELAPDNVDALMLRVHLSSSLEEKLHDLETVLNIDPDNAAAKANYELLRSTVQVVANKVTDSEPDVPQPSSVSSDELSQADEYDVVDPFATIANIEFPEEVAEYMESVDVEELAAANAETDESLGRSVEGIFDQDEPQADQAEVTVENLPELTAAASTEMADGVTCPFCQHPNDPQSFECAECHATLGFSDIESLLANNRVDRGPVQDAVTQMEAEWNLRDFSVDELTNLALGHVNLRNLDAGLQYLQEASRGEPNNVILAGQANTLAIRVDEIRRQSELQESMPRGKKILVVDDSATVRKLISSKLEKCGHFVVCAEDGIEALERLDEDLPDLVLLDITMPRMDGYEVCKEIRSRPQSRDLPVVMISGKDGFFDKVRGRMAGTTGYVTKPFGPETLMKALEVYLLPEAQFEPVAAE